VFYNSLTNKYLPTNVQYLREYQAPADFKPPPRDVNPNVPAVPIIPIIPIIPNIPNIPIVQPVSQPALPVPDGDYFDPPGLFPSVELDDRAPSRPLVIGDRVSVFWPKQKSFYPGFISRLADPSETHLGSHYVEYDDGDKRIEPLTVPDCKGRMFEFDIL